MSPVSIASRIFRSTRNLVLRFVHWLLSDSRWFYRGSHRSATVQPVTIDSLLSPVPDGAPEQAAAAEPVLTVVPAFEPVMEPEQPTVDVTFTLPSDVGAGDVLLCGDFNGWTAAPTPLRQGNDGAWQVTLPLEPGNSYHFRYLLDGQRWENAWQADRYEPNPFGSDNSVVIVDWPEFALQAA
jgi:hypothetical protein